MFFGEKGSRQTVEFLAGLAAWLQFEHGQSFAERTAKHGALPQSRVEKMDIMDSRERIGGFIAFSHGNMGIRPVDEGI